MVDDEIDADVDGGDGVMGIMMAAAAAVMVVSVSVFPCSGPKNRDLHLLY